MSLKIFNTLSGKKEIFEPLLEKSERGRGTHDIEITDKLNQ